MSSRNRENSESIRSQIENRQKIPLETKKFIIHAFIQNLMTLSEAQSWLEKHGYIMTRAAIRQSIERNKKHFGY